jgi:hypothetical protein
VELIKKHLGPAEWTRACGAWQEPFVIKLDEPSCVFANFKTYVVHGATNQFDFPMLPHCSYGYYVANGSRAIRLTREGKEIEQILASEWTELRQTSPVLLASFIIRFYDAGILASHRVLKDVEDLKAMCEPPSQYRLNETGLSAVRPQVGETSLRLDGDTVILRAVTLLGWMHMKSNLGIEHIRVAHDGRVTLEPRRVLTENTFARVPQLMY